MTFFENDWSETNLTPKKERPSHTWHRRPKLEGVYSLYRKTFYYYLEHLQHSSTAAAWISFGSFGSNQTARTARTHRDCLRTGSVWGPQEDSSREAGRGARGEQSFAPLVFEFVQVSFQRKLLFLHALRITSQHCFSFELHRYERFCFRATGERERERDSTEEVEPFFLFFLFDTICVGRHYCYPSFCSHTSILRSLICKRS